MKTNDINFRQKSACSLIELMVVIAIVAILAAVAVPSYKSHVAKARAANVINLMGSVVQRSMIFAENVGRFAFPNDLGTSGYYSNSGCSGCVSPAFIGSPPGVSLLYIHEWTPNVCGGSDQGKVGQLYATFDNTLTGTSFTYTWWLTRVNGAVQVTCTSTDASMNVGPCLSTNSPNALITAACAQ